MAEPSWTEVISVVAVVVSLAAIVVSVVTGQYLQKRQHRFELLATCLDDLSERERKANQLVQREVVGDYDGENTPWSHYQSAVEIYGLMKHHLPDTTALEGQVKSRGGLSVPVSAWRTPDTGWRLGPFRRPRYGGGYVRLAAEGLCR